MAEGGNVIPFRRNVPELGLTLEGEAARFVLTVANKNAISVEEVLGRAMQLLEITETTIADGSMVGVISETGRLFKKREFSEVIIPWAEVKQNHLSVCESPEDNQI